MCVCSGSVYAEFQFLYVFSPRFSCRKNELAFKQWHNSHIHALCRLLWEALIKFVFIFKAEDSFPSPSKERSRDGTWVGMGRFCLTPETCCFNLEVWWREVHVKWHSCAQCAGTALTASGCTKGGLNWAVGSISSQRGRSSAGAGCSGGWRSPEDLLIKSEIWVISWENWWDFLIVFLIKGGWLFKGA